MTDVAVVLIARLVVVDLMLRSEVSEPMSRGLALARVGEMLDSLAGADVMRRAWARGAADDTVYARTPEGMIIFAVIAVGVGQKPVTAALVWLEGFAEIQRAAGLKVTVARPKKPKH